jgi:hypothetical protein
MDRFGRVRRARVAGALCWSAAVAFWASPPAGALAPVSPAGARPAGSTGPAPVVLSVSPSLGPPEGGTAVTITGRNLAGATEVAFGGDRASITADGDGSITALSPAHPGGTVDVTVTTAGGTSALSSVDRFTYALTGAGPLPTPPGPGYDLVGADGGVFAFGDAPYLGSLPAEGVHVADIVGMVPTGGQGYDLVGADGGVFAFGDAPDLGSLPAEGVRTTGVVGLAATPGGHGYWLVTAAGTVYAFGDAPVYGSVSSPTAVTGIAATPDGAGYWVVTRNGSVYTFGDAGYFGSLPQFGVLPAEPVIGLVPTTDQRGYWLFGADGGTYAFGDAPFAGSLPGLGLSVHEVVGAAGAGT